MVRAAATGAIDYTGADPREKNWRIRHRLLLTEVQRQEETQLLAHAHRHWCAFMAHGNLTEESFSGVKDAINTGLLNLQNAIFPWHKTDKPDPKTGTIDAETQKLIDIYRQMTAENNG
jgi:hypothetical protein